MLLVIAPAKTLDYESALPTRKHSQPQMLGQSRVLVDLIASLSPDRVADLMNVSPAMAELTLGRYVDWDTPFTPANARPALLAFAGDVFQAINARETFTERDYTHAQKVLRILSGLYGVLRPLDLMQPYRLEMGLQLPNPRGESLYSFWGDRLTRAVAEAVEASPGSPALVNLASDEYFSALQPEAIDAKVVTPRFMVSKDGSEPTVNGFAAKRARGTMTSWIIRNRVRSVRALRDFDQGGYRFDRERSGRHQLTFVRRT